MGSCTGTTLGPNFSFISAMVLVKLAFSRSIWFTTIMRGLLAFLHMFMAFSTPTTGPDTAPTTIRAESARAIAALTSP